MRNATGQLETSVNEKYRSLFCEITGKYIYCEIFLVNLQLHLITLTIALICLDEVTLTLY